MWLLWHRSLPRSYLGRFGVDFFSGVSLFPLMLLIGCPFFPAARDALDSVSNVTLCSAGVVSLLAVLQNAFQRPAYPPTQP